MSSSARTMPAAAPFSTLFQSNNRMWPQDRPSGDVGRDIQAEAPAHTA